MVMFSPKTHIIYCFTYKPFSINLPNFTKRYTDWKHVYEKVSAYENSDNYRKWNKTMMNRSNSIQN